MDNLYLTSIEADITTIEIEQIKVNEVYSIAIKLLEDEDTAITTIESSEIIPLHPSLEIDMSSIKEGFKKAIKKIIEFFQWLGRIIVNFFKRIIDMFKNLIGIGKRERLEKEIKKTAEKARKVHENMTKAAKNEVDKIVKEMKENIENMENKEFEEYGKKIPVLFIGKTKLDTDDVPQFTIRLLHQVGYMLKYTNEYAVSIRQIVVELGLLLNKICGLAIDATNKNLEDIVNDKGMDILQEFNKNMRNVSSCISSFIEDAKAIKDNNDKYFKLVKDYLNIKEEYDTYVVLGNKVYTFKHSVDSDKIEKIKTEVDNISVMDIPNFTKLLKLINEYYDLIINGYITLTYRIYDIPPIDYKKVKNMISGLFSDTHTLLTAIKLITEIDNNETTKIINNYKYIDTIAKELKNDETYLSKISNETSKSLNVLLEKISKLDDKSIDGVLQRNIALSKELSKATTSMIKGVAHLAGIINSIINDAEVSIKLMNELIIYHTEVK